FAARAASLPALRRGTCRKRGAAPLRAKAVSLPGPPCETAAATGRPTSQWTSCRLAQARSPVQREDPSEELRDLWLHGERGLRQSGPRPALENWLAHTGRRAKEHPRTDSGDAPFELFRWRRLFPGCRHTGVRNRADSIA